MLNTLLLFICSTQYRQMKKDKIIKFGEDVEGYDVPVLNEREIRASAGIMFVALLIALMLILLERDFTLVKYVIVIFLTDFIIRVFVSPRFSPVLIIGRLAVSRQTPEYVGAPPKKFAWKIGLTLASLMFVLIVIMNSYSFITFTACMMCLAFLFFESAFGICLACWLYGIFYKTEPLLCAGEICKQQKKEEITKTSLMQIAIVVGAVVFILFITMFFNDNFRAAPKHLNEMIKLSSIAY